MEDHIKHYLISGRVQGVGFRRFVERTALGLNLRGWVRNLQDGRVEAWAEGPAGTILQLESRLKEGPPHARVESLVVTPKQSQHCTGFLIKNDGDQPCSDE